MKERPEEHVVRVSDDTYKLIDEEARREEAQKGGRVNRSRIAEDKIREWYQKRQRIETVS